jgi:hypothetical protein
MLSLVCDYAKCRCTSALKTELALAIWEYVITLASEVDLFWRKPLTAPSMLFIATRWIMVTAAVMQFAPPTETALGSMSFLRIMSDADIFLSNCEALNWAAAALGLAEFIGTARKQAHFTALSLLRVCILNGTMILHSILRHTSIRHMATKLYMGLRSSIFGNCSRGNKHSELTQLCFA